MFHQKVKLKKSFSFHQKSWTVCVCVFQIPFLRLRECSGRFPSSGGWDPNPAGEREAVQFVYSVNYGLFSALS